MFLYRGGFGFCLKSGKRDVKYEAPFDVNDSFAEIFSAFAEAQGEV